MVSALSGVAKKVVILTMSGSARRIALSIPPARWVGVAREAGRTRTLLEFKVGGVVEIGNRSRGSSCEIVGRSAKVDVGGQDW